MKTRKISAAQAREILRQRPRWGRSAYFQTWCDNRLPEAGTDSDLPRFLAPAAAPDNKRREVDAVKFRAKVDARKCQIELECAVRRAKLGKVGG